MTLTTYPLAYYAAHNCALFPLPAGSKVPGKADFWESTSNPGHAGSFKHDWSKDPAQWAKWREAHPDCNFGLVAFASRLIVVDIDTKIGCNEAWAAWVELCKAWGLDTVPMPQHHSPSGGWHVLFSIPDHIDPIMLRQPDAISGVIDVRTIGYVVAAGSTFNGKPYLLEPNAAAPYPAPQALIDHCIRKPAEKKAAVAPPGSLDQGDMRALLQWMTEQGLFADYDPWYKAGMALKLEFGDASYPLWGITFDERQVEKGDGPAKWDSFSTEPDSTSFTVLSLIDRARKAGWVGTIRKSTQAMFGDVVQRLASAPTVAPAVLDTKLIKSSGEFVANFVAPAYLLDGVLQRHFVYSFTAATGAGKTAIALRLASHVALGRKLGDRDVERGRVIYFASENYVDVQARWISMAQHVGFDVDVIDVHFVSGHSRLSEIADRITAEAEALGDIALVIVDTSAATFEGTEENSNVDSLQHAKRMRALTELRGHPTVLVLCHPVKSANNDNLLPRGGGAFIAEVDGNLCARKAGSAVEVHWAGKFRGMDFTPMLFRLETVVAHRLKDARGRNMPTVLAAPIDEAAKQHMAASDRSDQDLVLRAIEQGPDKSNVQIARELGWTMSNGEPYAVKVRRAAERLAGNGLIIKHRDRWVLTKNGEWEMNRLDRAKNTAVSPAPPAPLRIV